jgi:hypothetical protein
MKIILLSTMSALMLHASVNAQDITYKKMPAQISLMYPVSTSGKNSAHQDFIFSLNLLAGVTGQVNGFELGGLCNINKANVKGFQVAGLWNTVGGNFTGAHLAGLVNVTKHNSNSFQAAGLFNHAKDNMKGISIAGLFNNVSGKASGVQVAGLFNKTKILRGFQLGVLNIADTIERGMSMGLINIVKKGGYNEWELSFSDYQNMGISFKYGIKAFYNIYNIGFNVNEDKLWSAGFGFGHIQKLSTKSNFQPEAIVNTYFPSNFKEYKRTLSYRLKLGVSYSISDHISILAAPSIYYSDKEKGNKEGSYGYKFTSVKPLTESSNADSKSEIGLGFSVGVTYRNN